TTPSPTRHRPGVRSARPARCRWSVPQTNHPNKKIPMTPCSWTRKLFARVPHTTAKPPARYRPRLKALEVRTAPAVLTVNSTADTALSTDSSLSLREAIAIINSPTLPTGLSAQILAQISGTLHAGRSDTIQFDHARVTAPIVLSGTRLGLSLPSSTA